jgi:hypothetical protein
MSKNVVNWFEIPVNDIVRAKNFYINVFGYEMQDMNMPGSEMVAFPWEMNGENATGCLFKAEGCEPSPGGTVVYFTCPDVNGPLSMVEANGGSVVVPKTPIGEHGFFGQFIDSEGNRIGVHSIA